MSLVFVVNDVEGVKAEQSTTALAWRAALAQHAPAWTDIRSIEVGTDGAVRARCRRAAPSSSVDDWLAACKQAPPQVERLGRGSAVLIRTNPGRDAHRAALHDTVLSMLALARDHGAVVLNDPDGLRRAGSKLFLSRLPAWTRPETIVSPDAEALADWVRQRSEPSVLKPLSGTQGTDVFRVGVDDRSNLRQICAVVTRGGCGMAQAWLPEGPKGDVRLILLDGRLLEVDGQAAAVARIPGVGEFRSNVAQGGHAEAASFRPRWRKIIDAIGPILRSHGLWLVGLDMVGDHIVEANVFSPGGFVDAEALAGGVDFTGEVLASLLQHAEGG